MKNLFKKFGWTLIKSKELKKPTKPAFGFVGYENTLRKYHFVEWGYYYGIYMFIEDYSKDVKCSGVLIKAFPKGDDPEYAELCAKELLDELNKEV